MRKNKGRLNFIKTERTDENEVTELEGQSKDLANILRNDNVQLQTANKYLKLHSASLVIRKMQLNLRV